MGDKSKKSSDINEISSVINNFFRDIKKLFISLFVPASKKSLVKKPHSTSIHPNIKVKPATNKAHPTKTNVRSSVKSTEDEKRKSSTKVKSSGHLNRSSRVSRSGLNVNRARSRKKKEA